MENAPRVSSNIILLPFVWKSVDECITIRLQAERLGQLLIALAVLQLIWPVATLHNWDLVKTFALEAAPLSYLLLAVWAMFLFFIPYLLQQGITAYRYSRTAAPKPDEHFGIDYNQKRLILAAKINFAIQITAMALMLAPLKDSSFEYTPMLLGAFTLFSNMIILEKLSLKQQ